MANSIMQVDIVDSEEEIFSGSIEYLIAPGSEGELGIYPNHAPLISKLKSGVLRLKAPDHETQLVFAISGGFLEIQGNHATVLADVVERTDELDAQRLIDQKTEALAKLKRADSSSTADVAHAQAALEIAIAQLKALDYIKKHIHRS